MTQGIYILTFVDGRDRFTTELSLPDECIMKAKNGNLNAQRTIIRAFKGKLNLTIFIKWSKDVNPRTGGPLTIFRKANDRNYEEDGRKIKIDYTKPKTKTRFQQLRLF